MDLNIVTLEITDHISHFDYFERLISKRSDYNGALYEDINNISNKYKEHLAEHFAKIDFYDAEEQLLPLFEISVLIMHQIAVIKAKDIHTLIEVLEKDVKKIKKLYKAIGKS
ncbi:hypothetical protein MUGA111182_06430 [Mucilaginibacter galii]|uniref:Uncharacterized protein n=1 Tax=Mucilaginibacter galii TaxID=2005073 RepID=A0A917J9Y5_9SPHI|nr:hypothetical protein [Mucilaginibacter galii]GGI51713.1 hypothetical protein GCM10011425_29250 [Mucilaginibacter galii]